MKVTVLTPTTFLLRPNILASAFQELLAERIDEMLDCRRYEVPDLGQVAGDFPHTSAGRESIRDDGSDWSRLVAIRTSVAVAIREE